MAFLPQLMKEKVFFCQTIKRIHVWDVGLSTHVILNTYILHALALRRSVQGSFTRNPLAVFLRWELKEPQIKRKMACRGRKTFLNFSPDDFSPCALAGEILPLAGEFSLLQYRGGNGWGGG